MLDEKTLEWLEEREIFTVENEAYYSCAYCDKFKKNERCIALCPVEIWFVISRDVAEFEARVAAKLASPSGPEPCEQGEIKHCKWAMAVIEGKRTCSFCRMKYARIEVEQEMDEKL